MHLLCAVLRAGVGGCVLILLRCGCHRDGARPPTGLQQVGTVPTACHHVMFLCYPSFVYFLSFFLAPWLQLQCGQTLLLLDS